MLSTQTILTFIYCHVDDLLKHHFIPKGPGRPARFTDSELIALIFYKELAGIESERQLIRTIQRDYLALFPNLIDQSQFNRRARNLCWLIERIRQDLLIQLKAHWVERGIIDSTSVPLKHVVRAAMKRTPVSDLIGYGQRFAHKETYYGTKLHLLINRYGVPTELALTHPSVSDCKMVEPILSGHSNLIVLGDKGYCGYPLKERLFHNQSILLIAPVRRNQERSNTEIEKSLLRKGRLLIESVFNMLKSHLALDRILARTDEGFFARIHHKVTAFIFGIYLNQMLNRPGLAIKSLVT